MQTSKTQRILLFWLVCIPVRCGVAVAAWFAARGSPAIRYACATALAAIAAGFGYQIYKKPTHGGFGGVVWWEHLRLVHVVLFALASATLFVGDPCRSASVLLSFDALIGVISGLVQYA